ncbi:hypothetical protein B0H14DRAFT_3036839 [Mycena olivaceomarginata]|nr:hypothetical protein B0H14DRAFT_3036839 [Mycena olivaceomarginata]
MYIVSTGCSATLWLVAKRAFIKHGQIPEDTVAYLNSSPAVNLITAALLANIFIADSILIWRCWGVWNRKIKIIILPATCVLVGAVLGAISIAAEIQEGLVTATRGKRWAALAASYFTLALVSQLSATLLIIYRIFSLGVGQTHKYARVIEMLVESAAPKCIILICFLAFFVRSPSVNNFYPQAILVQTAGIGPTLIVARVTFDMARPEDEWKWGRKSGDTRPLEFRPLPLPTYMSRMSATITSTGSILWR